MRKFGAKALLTLLALNESGEKHADRDRTISLLSTIVTIGLIALFVWGKATSRW